MIFCATAIFIIAAHGRVSSYVSIENGAASPGRWQVWQCFCKIGATSLVKVGGGLFGSCPDAYPAQLRIAASTINKYFMDSPASRFGPRPTGIGHNRDSPL